MSSAASSPTSCTAREGQLLAVHPVRRRSAPRQGVETLLAAYQRLDNPPPLVLMGTFEEDTPPELPAGATAVDGAGHADVMASWDRSLFGVMPSLWPEPFGSAVHEAMSRGTAVIGTVPGGHRDMIDHGRNGLLVRTGDVNGLRDAIQMQLDDPEMRERLGRAARIKSDNFTAGVVVGKLDGFYRELLS